jgi:hypothetical protein
MMSQTRSILSFLLTPNIVHSYILIFKSTRRQFPGGNGACWCASAAMVRALSFCSLQESKTGFTGTTAFGGGFN